MDPSPLGVFLEWYFSTKLLGTRVMEAWDRWSEEEASLNQELSSEDLWTLLHLNIANI